MRAALFVLALLAAGCHHPDLTFPSPDGKHMAAVRNHWSIDPPKQSVWVDGTKIRDLAEDQDWCREVAWSPNGMMVGFLVQDAKLITVDAATKRIVSERWLVDRDGYPTSRMVCALRIDDTGEPAFTTKAR